MADRQADGVALAVAGVSGRMGQMLVALLREGGSARLGAALEAPGHPWIGRDLGEAMGLAPMGVIVTDDPAAVLPEVGGVVDFTRPAASVALAGHAAEAGVVHVIGTTGFEPRDLERIGAAALRTVIVRAGNMSLGVNLLLGLTRRVAAALGEEFDIEILESHHRHKVDAPSGTALMLGEAAAEGRGIALDAASERGRDGLTGPRAPGAIGFAVLRGGDVVGEHDVIFAGPGERIVLRHVATDRAIFARGAIRAAIWGQGQAPGEYDMQHVLGLAAGGPG